MNRKVLSSQLQYYVHTCCYSERCMADSIIWCSNQVVSSIGFYCINDGKSSSQCIVSSKISRSSKMDIATSLAY